MSYILALWFSIWVRLHFCLRTSPVLNTVSMTLSLVSSLIAARSFFFLVYLFFALFIFCFLAQLENYCFLVLLHRFCILACVHHCDSCCNCWKSGCHYCNILHCQTMQCSRMLPKSESCPHVKTYIWSDIHSRNKLDPYDPYTCSNYWVP